MKPTTQTMTGRQGNCFHACVASILEVPIESLPSHIPSKGWFQRLNRWLHRRGLGIVMVPANVSYAKGKSRRFTWDQCGYWIACGKTTQNKRVSGHAVVFKKGRFIFDPYPNVGRHGGLTEIDNYAFFTCVRPERMASKRHLRRKSCDGKMRYPSIESARIAIRSARSRDGGNYNAYHCKFCGGIHIGHRPKGYYRATQ